MEFKCELFVSLYNTKIACSSNLNFLWENEVTHIHCVQLPRLSKRTCSHLADALIQSDLQ